MWGSAILQPIVFTRFARISTVWGATIGSRFNVEAVAENPSSISCATGVEFSPGDDY